MKILIVGAGGTVGRAVVAAFGGRHEIVAASRTSATFRVNITDEASVRALFEAVGKVDAIVSTTGSVHFGSLVEMTPDHFKVGLHDKFLGQVALALVGQHFLRDGGSITLTTGILSEEPIALGVNATAVNAGIEGFARAAAIELPRSLRINVVSPTVTQESLDRFGPHFPGFEPVPVNRVALAYVRSVEGRQTGRVYRVW